MNSDAMPRCEFEESKLLLKLDITIMATISSIAPVVERVMELVGEMECSRGKEFEVEMALREALANAILHGARNDPSKQVQLCVACDIERGMLIIVRDPGQGFDPSKVASPVIGQNIYSEHGRGIFLINELMDEVQITRGGTEIVMRKR
jgi:serine/threonine-protein kinase RsbW